MENDMYFFGGGSQTGFKGRACSKAFDFGP